MSEPSSDPKGDVATALAHGERLLTTHPAMAAEQADEILKVLPDHLGAQLLRGAAHRARGRLNEARAVIGALVRAQPDWAEAQLEWGLALSASGEDEGALDALRRAVQLKPQLGSAWRALGDKLMLQGDAAGADGAYAQALRATTKDPHLIQAAAALCDNEIALAEQVLRAFLKTYPTDVAAIRMLAEVASRLGRYGDAENLLTRCLELAPGFSGARHNLAIVLYRQNKPAEALPHVEQLLAAESHNPSYAALKGAALSRLGEFERAIGLYSGILTTHPNQPKVWMSMGHALKTAGRTDESIDAYRRSIALAPQFGEAWWSLANLKTRPFSAEDIAAMRRALMRDDLSDDDRLHLDFALGKALEDEGAYADSFSHYAKGAALRRSALEYDPDATTEHVRRSKGLFSRDFLQSHAGQGALATDPIFVVGLPRSGSTLIEQILASHSAVEGTMELADLGAIAKRIGQTKKKSETSKYPEALNEMSAAALRALGQDYLKSTRLHRKSARPFFIDKMPNNFLHIGLIQLILPNAKIIDARRHPMAACFSAFKQHFARGQSFTYALDDLGRYYRDYVDLMAHFDAVAPGRIHRVIYERMVADTEGEVRRLLTYCGLPFEAGCLRFYANDRAVRTASSEQVRRPIFSDAVEHWRNYEPWLDSLKAALGPALTAYPDAP